VADELRVLERPALTRPVLVAAFRGWNDGGQGASLAGGENAFYHARLQGAERDAILLLGIEPNLRWRSFSELIVGLAKDLGVEMMVSLGALLADVPHTRDSPVTGSATDPALIEQLGLSTSRYEGPTGIVGILHDGCRDAGIRSVSLWAAVPHYVSLTPSPRAAKALCERLGELLEAEIDVDDLEEAAEAYAEKVSEAVAADSETAAYVEELERRADEAQDEQDLPSGDTLAAELTRYLQEHEARKREEEEERPE